MPKGVTVDERGRLNNFAIEPEMYVEQSSIGFTQQAEQLNGRLAMIGLLSALAIELLTGRGVIAAFTNGLF
ncbi:chlorophyll a/b-binding protein [Synechococcus sp. PCC 7336]|uniref:chlorophyll a/b-binding protein n=1 Tax=Synechococcus sp. PCC 7336 TaxID=195250 RepID=UPI0003497CD4